MLRRVLIAVTVLGFSCTVTRGQGPVGRYYLTQFAPSSQAKVHVIQGGSIVHSWTQAAGDEFAIAVGSDVRTLGRQTGALGVRYSLTGVDLGDRYAFPSGLQTPMDGTTDLVSNYTIDHMTGGVYRFDRNWANGQLMFDLEDIRYAGITYDFSDQSLWIGWFWGNIIEHRSLSGTLLGWFEVGHPYFTSLALDHQDDTLWFTSQLFPGELWQYSKSGTMLQHMTIPGVNDYWYGGEFQAVAEPASGGALCLALLLLRVRRRHLV